MANKLNKSLLRIDKIMYKKQAINKIKTTFKFNNFDSVNLSMSKFHPFHRGKVKIKKEVVPIGLKLKVGEKKKSCEKEVGKPKLRKTVKCIEGKSTFSSIGFTFSLKYGLPHSFLNPPRSQN